MLENPVNRVRWSGAPSIPEVEELLQRFGHAEIQLPPDFHHALFAHLYPQSAAQLEQIDESDGVELLHKIAGIRGLNEIGILESTVRDRHARVHLLSPVPLIILSLPPPKPHA